MMTYLVKVKIQDEHGDCHGEMKVSIELPQFDDSIEDKATAMDKWNDERFSRIKSATLDKMKEGEKLLVIESFEATNT
jgi:hypothetical protein